MNACGGRGPRARSLSRDAGSIHTAFENAVTDAKLDRPVHFHDLRHHFASWYVMAMTMRYSHLSPKHLREEIVRTERAETTPDRAQDRRMNPRNW